MTFLRRIDNPFSIGISKSEGKKWTLKPDLKPPDFFCMGMVRISLKTGSFLQELLHKFSGAFDGFLLNELNIN